LSEENQYLSRMNYIQVQLNDTDNEKNEILIALLANAGFESFEETDTTLKAFIKEAEFDQTDLDEIINLLNLNYTSSIIPQQNWNAQWESSFEPIIVNDFVGIRAFFHQPIKDVKYEIIITPKMSFGTGHHATTYMMIEQMEALDFTNKTVVDFGTGTAVLAILAEKMGAVAIDAIDYDEWSIENSIENAAANNCTKINLLKAETIATNKVYDIILANINLNVIMNNLVAIQSVSKKDSFILLSGFIKPDEEMMLKALTANGIHLLKTVQKGEWICMLTQMN
jgi:ribosomal protein L11 methyltransferase